jgi:CTP synthase (UTP-ammonia lyase)
LVRTEHEISDEIRNKCLVLCAKKAVIQSIDAATIYANLMLEEGLDVVAKEIRLA